TLIYSAGLRGQEVINLKISDIDFERKTIHIRQSKYKKDRVVPLADSSGIYHIVFTVPHHLNVLCLHNGRMFYNLFFSAVWHTLNSFGYSHYGVETGAIAVLHTWGQNLSLHPHIHCLVPAAGYSLDGRWKNIGHGGKFLYPVHQMSSAFKAKFPDSLKTRLAQTKPVDALQ
ncbi:MAG: transposase, partial [Proteiniphilum sp.]|nr:transposase [Proteiniphilum sp.]